MKRWIRAFNLPITATTRTAADNLRCDQPIEIEGSIILTMKGIPWVVIPEPQKSKVVASVKMIVMLTNTNVCPVEFNNGPLELQGTS